MSNAQKILEALTSYQVDMVLKHRGMLEITAARGNGALCLARRLKPGAPFRAPHHTSSRVRDRCPVFGRGI
jgi:hypothetical protein